MTECHGDSVLHVADSRGSVSMRGVRIHNNTAAVVQCNCPTRGCDLNLEDIEVYDNGDADVGAFDSGQWRDGHAASYHLFVPIRRCRLRLAVS